MKQIDSAFSIWPKVSLHFSESDKTEDRGLSVAVAASVWERPALPGTSHGFINAERGQSPYSLMKFSSIIAMKAQSLRDFLSGCRKISFLQASYFCCSGGLKFAGSRYWTVCRCSQ
jgi:hypothetical protein